MVLFINYNKKDDNFSVSGFFEREDGIIPFENREISLMHYPSLQEKLIEGKTLYINSHDCYLGTKEVEAPYGEQNTFSSEYESHNKELSELLLNIDTDIKSDNKNIRKLIKLGEYYK